MALGSPQWMYNSGEAYKLEQSLKFEDGRSPYLQRTFTTGNRQAMTLSFWFKRGTLGTTQIIFCATIPSGGSNNDNNFFALRIESDDKLAVVGYDTAWLRTNQKFRDPSAWYHCLLEVNSTSGSGYNRVKMAINGTYLPSGDITTSYPSENHNHSFNVSGNYCNISSRSGWLGDGYFDGYLAEMHYIDGSTAYDQSHFGETGDYGEWKPIEVEAITDYGTNGFYLPFKADYEVEGFNAVTYKGNAAEHYIGGVGFSPDLVWTKSTSTSGKEHIIVDSIRGSNSNLMAQSTSAENTASNRQIGLGAPDGYVITSNSGHLNESDKSYISWNWDMGADTPTGFACVMTKGTASAKTITGLGFKPDLVINDTLTAHQNTFVYDGIRGPKKELRTNGSNAEGTNDGVTSFESDGFRRGDSNDCNEDGVEYVDWCWYMGNTSVTNTDGSLTSTVMASTTYGQSIVKYTGNTASSATVGHGLNSAPEFMIVRTTGANAWAVYHASIGNTHLLEINTTAAKADNNEFWNDTSPTNSVFTIGSHDEVNHTQDYVAYCFHSVSGYSKFGTYTGDGTSNGSKTVNLGFRPAWVMIKCTNDSESWWVWDNVMNPFTNTQRRTALNSAASQTTNVSTSADNIQFTSTGFKMTGLGGGVNGNGNTYVYAAFAGGLDSISTFNTDGEYESRTKSNSTYKQGIATYHATDGGGDVGHGLGETPEVILIKRRDSTGHWVMHHHSINGSNKQIYLNLTSAKDTVNISSIGSSTFYVSGWSDVAVAGADYVSYVFKSVAGYSKFAGYTGNGSNTGPTVTCGFAPAFVIIKRVDATAHWYMYDNTREPKAEKGKALMSSTSNAEGSFYERLKFTSTGFQLTHTDSDLNGNGGEYVYMAFADKREYAYWLDQSGKNNDFRSYNLSESDISVDNPSNNFATLNPLDKNGTITASDGNLYYNSSLGMMRGTMAGNANDKFYLEYLQVSNITPSNPALFGIGAITEQPNHESNHIASVILALDSNTQKRVRIFLNNSQVQSTDFDALVGYDDGDITMFAYDGTTGKVWVGINGNWLQGDPATGTSPIYTFSDTSHPMTAFVDHAGVAHAGMLNFGQDSSFGGRKTGRGYTDGNGKSDFYYEPPSGFLALSSANLKDNDLKPSEHFNTVLYSGNGSDNRSISVGFQPDLVWLKARSQAYNHYIYDSVRGANKQLLPHVTNGEQTTGDRMQAFESNGFQLGTSGEINQNSQTYVAWNWKAGTSVSGNSSGSGTAQSYTGSVNSDAGFSIIKYTGNGTDGMQVPHHLGVVPDAIWIKSLTTQSWNCFFPNARGANKGLQLDNSGAEGGPFFSTHLSDEMPTTSVVKLGNGAMTNTFADGVGQDYIMYCWANKDGYSKVGYYKGNNNNNGSFVYTGFKPALVIIKNTGSAGWHIKTAEVQNNEITKYLYADTSAAENDTTNHGIDFLSNGFKLRTTAGYAETNGDGNTIVYMAFAEVPQKYSNAR